MTAKAIYILDNFAEIFYVLFRVLYKKCETVLFLSAAS